MPSPAELAELVSKLEQLKSDLQATASSEAVAKAEVLLREVEALRQKAASDTKADAQSPARDKRHRRKANRTARPESSDPGLQKREYVVLALQELGRPSSPAVVSQVISSLWNADVAPSQFASIRAGDERAWKRGRRTKPLVVPALNAFDLSARPRTVALSTWPLEIRVMGSLSDRGDALRSILAAAEKWRAGGGKIWCDLMMKIARDFRFAPASRDIDAAKVSEQAASTLRTIIDADDAERATAAERARRLSEDWQVFGRPIGFEVIQGGKGA